MCFILYRLLPLAFSSIKDISLLQNLTNHSSSTRSSNTPTNTNTTLTANNTTSTEADSLQPPPSSTNGSLISTELRTLTSPINQFDSLGCEHKSIAPLIVMGLHNNKSPPLYMYLKCPMLKGPLWQEGDIPCLLIYMTC